MSVKILVFLKYISYDDEYEDLVHSDTVIYYIKKQTLTNKVLNDFKQLSIITIYELVLSLL